MRHTEGTFEAGNGSRLFEQWWRPEGEPKAVVVIVHGYAEHTSRYIHVARYLTGEGYAVYAFDLRGHGRSGGARVLVRSFDEYLCDLKQVLSRIPDKEPEKPVFLLGHSLGGAIVTLFTIIHKPDVRGLILSGPLLKMSSKISIFRHIFIFIAACIFPGLPVLKKLNARSLSHDPDVIAGYDNDPLVYHGELLAREAREIGWAVYRIRKQMESIVIPLLILHGTGDRLVDPGGSRELYTRARSQDKTLKLYEGLYHEVLNEPEKDQVLKDICAWLDARV